MNILICDDELAILREIAKKIKSVLPESRCLEIIDAEKLLELLQEQKLQQKQEWDVLLLDIDMPHINGLEIAKRMENLKKKPLLIFVTNHDELVYDSFQFHPFGFVRKAYMDKELPKVLFDCEKEIAEQNRNYHIHTAEGEVKLLLEDIFYFESKGNYLHVYTTKESYRFRSTIATVQKELEKYGFIRIHRGFLVNQAAVEVLGSDVLKLVNGMTLPIGRSYAETTKRKMMRYMLR